MKIKKKVNIDKIKLSRAPPKIYHFRKQNMIEKTNQYKQKKSQKDDINKSKK